MLFCLLIAQGFHFRPVVFYQSRQRPPIAEKILDIMHPAANLFVEVNGVLLTVKEVLKK